MVKDKGERTKERKMGKATPAELKEEPGVPALQHFQRGAIIPHWPFQCVVQLIIFTT